MRNRAFQNGPPLPLSRLSNPQILNPGSWLSEQALTTLSCPVCAQGVVFMNLPSIQVLLSVMSVCEGECEKGRKVQGEGVTAERCSRGQGWISMGWEVQGA